MRNIVFEIWHENSLGILRNLPFRLQNIQVFLGFLSFTHENVLSLKYKHVWKDVSAVVSGRFFLCFNEKAFFLQLSAFNYDQNEEKNLMDVVCEEE